MSRRALRIGGASGYWGDAGHATAQLLGDEHLDVLVYDYLAEVTMSILARARARAPELGFATDFVEVLRPHLRALAERRIRVVANAGGVNPSACAQALRAAIAEAGVALKVATVTGDDLLPDREALAESGVRDMFGGTPFPPPRTVLSVNAYLGAFPIARALERGADVVVTGRCVDSALALGACIDAFGWRREDFDQLAAGSLAGHLIECGTQLTGGNFTDWESIAPTLVDAGYPIAEVDADGHVVCTKPAGTGGTVTVATVAEQLLYEIGDPRAYVLPDVTCDFTEVSLRQVAPDRVAVAGALGRPGPPDYKVCATFADGYRGGEIWTYVGRNAAGKARVLASMALARARRSLERRGLPDFTEVCTEIVGAASQSAPSDPGDGADEVDLKIAVRHPSAEGVAILQRELVGCALAAPPGLTAFVGGRPKPMPVVRLFSFLVPKSRVLARVDVDGEDVPGTGAEPDHAPGEAVRNDAPRGPMPPFVGPPQTDWVCVRLEDLAWARSGDKGDDANIGVIARRPEWLPYVWAALDERAVAARFRHFLTGSVDRYWLPGIGAINFVLHGALGGGGTASLRTDPQGKAFAQTLLSHAIPVPARIAAEAAARHLPTI